MGQVTLLKAKNGLPSIKIGEIQYHSAYNPQIEAERFLNHTLTQSTQSKNQFPSVVIIIGSGLGYLDRAIKRINPLIKTINLCLSQEIAKHADISPENIVLYESPDILINYLKQTIAEFDIPYIKTIVWPPANRIFKDKVEEIERTILDFIKEYSGNLKTTVATGKRLIRNTFRNFLFLNSPIEEPKIKTGLPIVITASGPSLEHSISLIQQYRSQIFLVALPSSLSIFNENSINPDLIIITDPSYYSIYHLTLYKPQMPIPVLIPYSGPTGLWALPYLPIVFTQANFFERELVKQANLSVPHIPSQGTVAATAINYIVSKTTNPIIFAGLDLCYYDVFSHFRGSSVDHYFSMISNKFKPYLTHKIEKLHMEHAYQIYSNEPKHNRNKYLTTESLSLYASWFNNIVSANNPRRFTPIVFRINPSPIKLRNIPNLSPREFNNLLQSGSSENEKPYIKNRMQYPEIEKRKTILKNAIEDWISQLNRVSKAGNKLLKDITFINFAYYINLKKLGVIKKTIIDGNSLMAIEMASNLNREIQNFLHEFYLKYLR